MIKPIPDMPVLHPHTLSPCYILSSWKQGSRHAWGLKLLLSLENCTSCFILALAGSLYSLVMKHNMIPHCLLHKDLQHQKDLFEAWKPNLGKRFVCQGNCLLQTITGAQVSALEKFFIFTRSKRPEWRCKNGGFAYQNRKYASFLVISMIAQISL